MERPSVDDDTMRQLLAAVRARLGRAFSEGDYVWPRRDLLKEFHNMVDLNDPRLQSALRAWEKTGAIRLIGRDDCYIEVLGRIPD